MRTWQNLFDEERERVNDHARIVKCTLTKEELSSEFRAVLAADEQAADQLVEAFAWTPSRVYVLCRTHRYELGISSILRHPPI